MKTRVGFVSNSSSTSYILDITQKGVKSLLDRCSAPRGDFYGRSSGIVYGIEINDLINDIKVYNDIHAEWINGWIEKIGIDNIVYLRECDENDQIFDNEKDYVKLHKLILDEQEFH